MRPIIHRINGRDPSHWNAFAVRVQWMKNSWQKFRLKWIDSEKKLNFVGTKESINSNLNFHVVKCMYTFCWYASEIWWIKLEMRIHGGLSTTALCFILILLIHVISTDLKFRVRMRALIKFYEHGNTVPNTCSKTWKKMLNEPTILEY